MLPPIMHIHSFANTKCAKGAVSQVRKKEQAKGGSARPENVRKAKTSLCTFDCFPILGPIFGWAARKTSKQDAFASSRSEGSLETEDTEETTLSLEDPSSNSPGRQSTSSMITYGKRKEVTYALKSIILDRCSRQEFVQELRNEVEILKNMDHPNIVRALETYEYKNQLYIVLEHCRGGDLYTRDPYTEDQVHRIVTSLFKAVSYMHSQGIVHRDIKFENIMFVNSSSNSTVRIIDFGLSQKFAANQHLHATVGTAYVDNVCDGHR